MNARGGAIVLALCLCFLGQPTLNAADGWWGSPSGSSTSSANASSTSKKSTKSSWFAWPASSSKSSSKPKSSARSKPSMFQSVTQSTKRTWNKTVDFFKSPFATKPAGAPLGGSQPNTGAWFPPRDPQQKPSSVPEWLSGDMPRF